MRAVLRTAVKPRRAVENVNCRQLAFSLPTNTTPILASQCPQRLFRPSLLFGLSTAGPWNDCDFYHGRGDAPPFRGGHLAHAPATVADCMRRAHTESTYTRLLEDGHARCVHSKIARA